MILSASLQISTASDLVTLIKPRVTLLVLATTAAGLWMAPNPLSLKTIIAVLAGTMLLVGAANALNMYLERDLDALMRRTCQRPLPAKRLSPPVALVFGILLATISSLILVLGTNRLTACLGLFAFVTYVLFYTPLKQKSYAALLIGAVPGAIPPLMGWTAATNILAPPGLVLFFILFLWQVPHFLAIALFRKEEYEQAGIKILPLEKGDLATKYCILRYSVGLVAVSLYPVILGTAGQTYFWIALLLGLSFLGYGAYGLRSRLNRNWARNFFFASLIYLPITLISLILGKT